MHPRCRNIEGDAAVTRPAFVELLVSGKYGSAP